MKKTFLLVTGLLVLAIGFIVYQTNIITSLNDDHLLLLQKLQQVKDTVIDDELIVEEQKTTLQGYPQEGISEKDWREKEYRPDEISITRFNNLICNDVAEVLRDSHYNSFISVSVPNITLNIPYVEQRLVNSGEQYIIEPYNKESDSLAFGKLVSNPEGAPIDACIESYYSLQLTWLNSNTFEPPFINKFTEHTTEIINDIEVNIYVNYGLFTFIDAIFEVGDYSYKLSTDRESVELIRQVLSTITLQ